MELGVGVGLGVGLGLGLGLVGFGHRCDEDLRAFGDARGDVRAELPAHARPHLPALRLAMPPPTRAAWGWGQGRVRVRVRVGSG